MRNSYDVTEIGIFIILSTLQNIHFWECSIFVYRFGLKPYQNIGKMFKTIIIVITKYLNWNIVKILVSI